MKIANSIFSKNSNILFSFTENEVHSFELNSLARSKCTLSSDEKILNILPFGLDKALSVGHAVSDNSMVIRSLSSSGQCLVLNKLPFLREDFAGILASALNESNSILGISGNFKLNTAEGSLRTYVIPLNGQAPIAASASGMAAENKKYGNQIQMFFSSDSSQVFFVGHGGTGTSEAHKSLLYSFPLPRQLIK